MTDELDKLRKENEELKWHIRVLTRKQDIPDMVNVDFPRLEGTYNMIKDDPRLSPIAEELFKALMEMKDAYQVHDNAYNFFKNAIWAALDGAPELTEEEHEAAYTTVVGVIEKLMAGYKQRGDDLKEAIGFIEALYSQQAMPDDSLNPLVDAFLEKHND